jgi:hypothetical protein
MKPDTALLNNGSGKNKVFLLAEKGKQYAFYQMGGKKIHFEVELPKGLYTLKWLNPLTGKKEKKKRLRHSGGKINLESPAFSQDIALKLIAR